MATYPRPRRRAALLAVATTAAALTAPPALAHHREPDAEIFATNNTRLITDPADPALHDRLRGFAAKVKRVIRRGGGVPARSQLLDGVFFSAAFRTTTFERSREFDLNHVSIRQLHDIAETIRVRFRQQSVLTFDHLRARDARVDAVELEVPGITADALRFGMLADAQAREELFGGSVTQDHRLLLVAELADLRLAKRFAARIGGDLADAGLHYGDSEFVG
jgi:hypothetical protein